MHSILPFLVLIGMPTIVFPANEPVQFADGRLKEIIERRLGVSNPTPADMLGLTELKTTAITDLMGLEHAKNLTRLCIDNTLFRRQPYTERRIEDISYLSPLKRLVSLELIRNRITDITPLSGLEQLQELNLKENRIADISALSSLAKLETLNLSKNLLCNVSALRGLSRISWLELQWNRIQDINVLSSLTEMEWLNLRGNAISDISGLAGLVKLQKLDLSENQIEDIAPLSSLSNLATVSLRFNRMRHGAVLALLPKLEELDVSNTPYYVRQSLTKLCVTMSAIILGVVLWYSLRHGEKSGKERPCLRIGFAIACGLGSLFHLWLCCHFLRLLLPYDILYSRQTLINNSLFVLGIMAGLLVVGFVCVSSVLLQGTHNHSSRKSRPSALATLLFLVLVSLMCCSYSLFYFVLRGA